MMNHSRVPLNADELFRSRYERECLWVHRFMTWIMFGQLLLGIGFAAFWSPFTWIGQNQEIHLHIWAGIVIGGSLTGFAVCWIRYFPREASTRHVVAITQVLWSALLIHLSGGRIETHFHVFVSLAILSIYRDWKILISATVVVAADHFIRGVFYPASVFGVFTESPYRWIEHAAWVLFEVAFLAPSCYRLRNEVYELCARQSEIEEAKKNVDKQVSERTRELRVANATLNEKTAEAEKLAMVAKYTDNAVVITDRRSSIEWVNSGYTRITGYSLAEVVGKRPSDYLHGPETDPSTVEQMREAIRRREGFNTEIINYRKNGEPFWLAMEVRPITNAEGDVVRFIAIQSDITQRKQMELSLADTEARLRSIINNVPGAFYRRELDGSVKGKTLFISHCIDEFTGHAADEFTGSKALSYLDFVHPDDIDELHQKLHQAIEEGREFEHEYRMVDDEQKIRWVSEKGQCMTVGEGESSQVVVDGVLFDISQRIEAESENQKLHSELLDASRHAGMAEIATGVLHNVGNILNSVNISTSIIRKRFAKSALSNLERISALIAEHESTFGDFVREDDRGRKVPAYILKVTGALCDERSKINQEFDDLIRNVEHIKEIVSVQQSMAKTSGIIQQLKPSELIRDAITANKASLQTHRIQIVQTIDESIPSFLADKHRILQILVNLIKNAKDAITEHGTTSPQIQVTFAKDNGMAKFQVSDNGMGISEDKLEKIFQHGFTTKKSGHGFGLHSSANAAVEMGGSLRVSSEGEGKGAQFELRLPLTPPKITTRSTKAPQRETAATDSEEGLF